jgi:hypothetical protein
MWIIRWSEDANRFLLLLPMLEDPSREEEEAFSSLAI